MTSLLTMRAPPEDAQLDLPHTRGPSRMCRPNARSDPPLGIHAAHRSCAFLSSSETVAAQTSAASSVPWHAPNTCYILQTPVRRPGRGQGMTKPVHLQVMLGASSSAHLHPDHVSCPKTLPPGCCAGAAVSMRLPHPQVTSCRACGDLMPCMR
eukprot:364988-Chlamydomonas_euryale.AAC.18